MRSKVVVAGVLAFLFLAVEAGPIQACNQGPLEGCWNCPRPGWGPGYDHQPGYGYGYRYDYGWWGYGPRGYRMGPDRSAFGDTLSKGEAEKLVQWVVRGNPNLEVGKVTEVEGGYRVEVVTRKGKSLVDTLMVEKDTARVYPVYE
ncbi:MAG: hypothetical protein P1S46_05845 [bacterium]|nr:hypothetical protein [bacterium]MDT8396839.1 hypothetical protein [bacterium]